MGVMVPCGARFSCVSMTQTLDISTLYFQAGLKIEL